MNQFKVKIDRSDFHISEYFTKHSLITIFIDPKTFVDDEVSHQ